MRLTLCIALFAASALPATANDGFGGLSATGLTFDQTGAAAMVEENLFIGIDKIAVDYVFRNFSDHDVPGEVIFPLPPVYVWSPWEENRPLSQVYDTPGRDVTAELGRFGLPLTLDVEALRDMLLAMPPNDQAALKAAGIADFHTEDGALAPLTEAYGLWSIVTRYHWTQTFPAGAEVQVSDAYTNRPPGGRFYWIDPPSEDQTEIADQYCVDDGTSKAIANALGKPRCGRFGQLRKRIQYRLCPAHGQQLGRANRQVHLDAGQG